VGVTFGADGGHVGWARTLAGPFLEDASVP
jgi:hypothetical protein